MKHPLAAVIIPVYGAFEDALECLTSVVRNTRLGTQIIVVDDHSQCGEFRKFIPWWLRTYPGIQIVRNKTNLGFVRSCNLAIQLAGSKDVVLLNSDTIVTRAWLVKLKQAAYSNSKVGTVTPLTNNGVIASFPTFCHDNVLPKNYDLNGFADLVSNVARPFYPELPTAVGFCMYIKREVLNIVGILDDQAFGKGYGEENDFCLRAQAAGYKDILDDATYIYHKGSLSFREEKADLCEKNSKIIAERYPNYFPRVAKFCQEFPLLPVHARILDEMVVRWNRSKNRNVLHLSHNGPYEPYWHNLGGTELLIQDIIDNDSDSAHWSLVPVREGYYLTAHLAPIHRRYFIKREGAKIEDVISDSFFDLIHLHHAARFDYGELVDTLIAHGRYLVSVHDYSSICPRNFLMTPELKICDGNQCQSVCGYDMEDVHKLRERTESLLMKAHKVITFSPSVVNYMTAISNARPNWHIMHHGIKDAIRVAPANKRTQPNMNIPLEIAFVGAFSPHKGQSLVSELVTHSKLRNGISLKWHLIGEIDKSISSNLIQHGSYTRGELSEKLRRLNPHLVLIPSMCPETYGMTLDETLNAGIPVLVTPFGAPAERVTSDQSGWVLSALGVGEILAKLEEILNNWPEYLETVQRIGNVKLRSVTDEAEEVNDIYRELVPKGQQENSSRLLEILEGKTIEKAKPFRIFRRPLRIVKNALVPARG